MRKRYSTAGNQQSSTLFLLLSSLIGQQYIKTHYQVTEGYVISYGEIVNYELVYNKFLEQKKILFSINGELL